MTPRTGRPRSFDRALALDRAMDLFWRRGYDTVGIKDLTATLGISDSSLYAAFGSKSALFAEVVNEYAQRYGGYTEEAATAVTAREAAEILLRNAALQQTAPERPHGCLIVDGATNHLPASAPIAADLRRRRDSVTAMIEEKAEADIAEGALLGDVSARTRALHVTAVWEGNAHLARDGASRAELLGVVDLALQCWDATGGV